MHNRTEEDIIFEKSMTATGNMIRRAQVTKIINQDRVHLSLSLQQEILTLQTEELDKLRHTIAKQDRVAAKSTLFTQEQNHDKKR